MPYIQYNEIKLLADDGLAVKVSFWNNEASFDAGDPPIDINQFHFIGLRTTAGRHIYRTQNDVLETQLVDQSWVAETEWDPDNQRQAVEIYTVNLRNLLDAQVKSYWDRFSKLTQQQQQNRSSSPMDVPPTKSDSLDTHGLLTVDILNSRNDRGTL